MLRWLWRPASRGWSPRWRAPARGKSWRRDRAIACSQATLPCGRGADAATMASWVVTWGAGRSSGRCKAGDRFRNDQHEDRYRGGRLDHVHVLDPRGENLCHPGVEAKADHEGRVQIVVEAGRPVLPAVNLVALLGEFEIGPLGSGGPAPVWASRVGAPVPEGENHHVHDPQQPGIHEQSGRPGVAGVEADRSQDVYDRRHDVDQCRPHRDSEKDSNRAALAQQPVYDDDGQEYAREANVPLRLEVAVRQSRGAALVDQIRGRESDGAECLQYGDGGKSDDSGKVVTAGAGKPHQARRESRPARRRCNRDGALCGHFGRLRLDNHTSLRRTTAPTAAAAARNVSSSSDTPGRKPETTNPPFRTGGKKIFPSTTGSPTFSRGYKLASGLWGSTAGASS